MKNERREFTRYASKSKVLEIRIHGSDVVEKIQDISMGGLAVEYSIIHGKKLEIGLIDISWNDKDPSYLAMIPCEVIYDHVTLPQGRTFRGRNMRRCGLRYKSVLEMHKERLQALFSSNDMVPA